jgi:glycosyltransferase involved in cell wall biosynthesis
MREREPIASVLIPTYNRSVLLRRAVRCALEQSEGRIEVVVVDDASTDETSIWMQSVDDGRVRYIRHDMNRGVSAAWQTALREARGEYVAFLPDDDLVEQSFISNRLSRLAAEPDCVVAFSRYRIESVGGKALDIVNADFGDERRLEPLELLEAALVGRVFTTAAVFRRSALDDLPSRVFGVGNAVDYAMTVEIALAGGAGIFLPIDDVVYVDHPGQTRHGSGWRKVSAGRADYLQDVLQTYPAAPVHRLVRRELSNWHTVWGRRLVSSGRGAEARTHFLRGIRIDPRNTWAWKQLARSLRHP